PAPQLPFPAGVLPATSRHLKNRQQWLREQREWPARPHNRTRPIDELPFNRIIAQFNYRKQAIALIDPNREQPSLFQRHFENPSFRPGRFRGLFGGTRPWYRSVPLAINLRLLSGLCGTKPWYRRYAGAVLSP